MGQGDPSYLIVPWHLKAAMRSLVKDFWEGVKIFKTIFLKLLKRNTIYLASTPLEIMPRCSAVGLGFIIIPVGLIPCWNF